MEGMVCQKDARLWFSMVILNLMKLIMIMSKSIGDENVAWLSNIANLPNLSGKAPGRAVLKGFSRETEKFQ